MIDVGTPGQRHSQPSDFVALQPGQTIGRYEILALLGRGGFGITYRARDTQLNREVAIKEYLPSALAMRQGGTAVLPQSTRMADDFTWGRDRFVEEGRTLATLQHAPAIVEVFDFLEANGTAYIVMKLMPGETLEDRLQRGALDQPAIERILWPLLEGLQQVHATGYLHRDIKPANILLDAQGNPTLIDFGASRAAMAGRTTVLTAIFTPGYAAPEQFSSAKQGPWTDIYGLAATLYHAITGTTTPSAFDRLIEDTFRPLAEIKPAGFTPHLLSGIDAGLVLRADSRPQSIADWRRALTGDAPGGAQPTVMLGSSGAAPTQAMRPPETQPTQPPQASVPPQASLLSRWWRDRRRRRLIVLAIVAVFAFGGGIQRFAERQGWLVPSEPIASPDGRWRGSYNCGANDVAGDFSIALDLTIANGHGKWVRPPTEKSRNLSLTLSVEGTKVIVVREFERANVSGTLVATSTAHYRGSRITGHGGEENSRGRVCQLELVRASP
jgi:serine/threonine protein kinase